MSTPERQNGRFDRRLVVRRDGGFVLTPRGALSQELTRIEKQLRSQVDNNINFTMSEEMSGILYDRKKELCAILDMPGDEKSRSAKIKRHERRLTEAGFPPWRIKI